MQDGIKHFLVATMFLLLLAGTSFAQDNALKIIIAGGGTIPLENFSTKSDIGFGTCIGFEKQIGDNFTFVGAWTHTENSAFKIGKGIAKGTIFDARFRYYFKNLDFKWLAVNPYMIFGAGIARVDWTADEFTPEFILSTATGAGALWKIKDNLSVFFEGELLTGGDEISRLFVKTGFVIPLELKVKIF